VLEPYNTLYQNWLTPQVPIYFNFNVFNLTNPVEFENGAMPIFNEIGPFVYKEDIIKEKIVNNMNLTISYEEARRLTFLPDKSAYKEDVVITTLNTAVATVVFQMRFQVGIIHSLINQALKSTSETMTVTLPANQLLFGYKDNFLAFLKPLVDVIDPKLIPTDMIGLYFGVC
jgi:scavenger receptor class B, member 1